MGSSWNYLWTCNCIAPDSLRVLILQQVKQNSKGKVFVQTLMWKGTVIYVNNKSISHLLSLVLPPPRDQPSSWPELFTQHPIVLVQPSSSNWESIFSVICGRANLLTHVAWAAPIQLAMRNEKRCRLKPLTSSPGKSCKMLLPVTQKLGVWYSITE